MPRIRHSILFSPRSGSRFLAAGALVAIVTLESFAQPLQVQGDAIVSHLNAVIRWYRHVASVDQATAQPSDVLYLQNARSLAAQAVQLAFQSARAEAPLIESEKAAGSSNGSAGTNTGAPAAQSGIAKALADAASSASQIKSRIEDLGHKIDSSRGKKRQDLTSQRAILQGELDLVQARQDALQKIASFENSSQNGQSGLDGTINQLRQTVPDAFASSSAQAPSVAGQQSKSSKAQSSGLFGQASILFSQMRDVHDIDQLMAETARLRDTAATLQAPLRNALKAMLRQNGNEVNQPPPTEPAQVEALRRTLELQTARFKQIAAAAVPLRQEIILLDQCHASLQDWRDAMMHEYGRVLRSLLTRVIAILVALTFVFFLSALWRKATYRYVKEPRRRRQVMLVRRFFTGFLMAVVIALGFISEFSSLATFAGFLTAGIAVALQTIILSVAAYFFLIGRYGVRVGDRITVSGVTGDVVEVGLVRLYMMELSGTGIDLYPTGRIVAFSNSVLFQSAPLFKQIPGTAYAWHEVAVSLASDGNYEVAERDLLAAVNSVYAQYRQNIERQQHIVERLMDAPLASPEPKSQLSFAENGLEFVIRYPVEIHRSAEIDEQITRKLLEAIGSQEELRTAVSGSPRLRAPVKV